jgi:hypothetical protein
MEKEKEANKHEKVNGMVKWNYLGHRRTVDPNKVKGMAKTEYMRYMCCAHIFRLLINRVHPRRKTFHCNLINRESEKWKKKLIMASANR